MCARIYVLFRSRDHFFHLLPFALFYFNFRFILGLDRETVHVRRFRKIGYERNLYYNFMNKSSESLFKVFDWEIKFHQIFDWKKDKEKEEGKFHRLAIRASNFYTENEIFAL